MIKPQVHVARGPLSSHADMATSFKSGHFTPEVEFSTLQFVISVSHAQRRALAIKHAAWYVPVEIVKIGHTNTTGLPERIK